MYEHREVSFSAIVQNAMSGQHRRVFERNRRKGILQPEFLRHRFPVRGGLTFCDILAHQMTKTNRILQRLMAKDLYAEGDD